MRRSALLLGVLLVLGTAGCARNTWVRPGASAADLDSDTQLCHKEVQSGMRNTPTLYAANSTQVATNSFMSGVMDGLRDVEFWQKCMEGRNWTRVPRDKSASSPP